jgi:dephospho-CoA kinase
VSVPETGEDRVLLVRRPSLRAVLVMGGGRLVLLGTLGVIGAWLTTGAAWAAGAAALGLWIVLGAGTLAVVLLAWLALVCWAMRFELRERRVVARGGVLGRWSVEAPLEQATNVVVLRRLGERLLGLGTVAVFTPAAGGEVVWRLVTDAERLAERIGEQARLVRDGRVRAGPGPGVGPGVRSGAEDGAMRGAGRHAGPMDTGMSQGPSGGTSGSADAARGEAAAARPVVLGIAGGIGSGKSRFAAALGRLGCHVIDSDQRAKAALDRPDVRARLVEWWGERVVGAGGAVDRSVVASIIFGDARERARLEALVHPIVRQERAAMIREAALAGARGVVVDAPLLFEAGVDKECDAVVFVDAPLDVRLERVRATRGWSDEELVRRERAQMPVEEKRARCRYVVDNSGRPGTRGLDEQAREILEDAVRRAGSGAERGRV